MIEIKFEDLQLMIVWDDEDRKKVRRWVIGKLDNYYIAVTGAHETKEEALKAIKLSWYPFICWQHARPIKLTAVVKSAEEITGIKNATKFKLEISEHEVYIYTEQHNKLAGQRIDIVPDNLYGYDFLSIDLKWLKSWLKDFREEKE